jgi:hypothetical protein
MRFHVQFYVLTHGGRKLIKRAVMTLAQIEATVACTNWRTSGIEVAG